MNNNTEMQQLKEEYERLKIRANRLFNEWNEIDRRMQELERVLPEDYPRADDPGRDIPQPR